MNKLLAIVLKNKLLNNVFTFIATIVIFTLACLVSAGVFVGIASFLSVFVAGGFAYKTVEWCNIKHKELNNIK